ncbi:MAG: hypothetical protein JW822_06340 [Spirochaetales bacterium]|nr:hypothetical protein [Spirochaetales bacterium]
MIIRGFAIPKKIKRKIINLAQKSGGEISISEVVAELNLTTRQSKKALNKIVKEGHANERKSPTRGVLYRFPGLIKNDLEQNMYEIIKFMGGKVTAFDLSQKTGQSIEESRKILDYFVKIGEAEIRIAQNAIEVYEFKGVLSKKQKNQSETII